MEVICSAISEAKKKILLKIYHISSEKIIDLLVKQSANIPVCVHYQESPDLESLARGSQIMLDKREGDALLHKKTSHSVQHPPTLAKNSKKSLTGSYL